MWQIRTEEMDKLAEWGIAAYHSGRWVAERESDAMGPFARKGGNGAVAGTMAPHSSGSSSCLNDVDIARRVGTPYLVKHLMAHGPCSKSWLRLQPLSLFAF